MKERPKTLRLRWVGLGLLLIQLGWVVAIPPFAAMDEWDHAYRAAAVAHGQVVAPPSEATRGTGAYVHVPSDIVRAARSECERLHYGGQDECVGTVDGEFSEVASGAGRYPPAFYALVGWPSIFLDGVAALYAMRLAGLLLCWGLVMAALQSLGRWASPLTGLSVCFALTPTVIYASAAVAPNGLEMVSGLAFWASLASIAHDRERRALDGQTVTLALVSGSLLLSLRSLGPLWAALILAIALVAWPGLRPRLTGFLRTGRGVAASLWAVAVGVGSIWWIQTQGALEVGRSDAGAVDLARRFQLGLRESVVWTFQYMGAFPYRNNPAPPAVYACLLTVIIVLGVVAFRRAASRERWALAATMAVAYGVPFAITVATVERYGTAWQGRYTLPFLFGTLVVCGVILSRTVTSPKPWLLYGAVVLVTTAHAISVVNTQHLEVQMLERTSTPLWTLHTNPAVLTLLAVVGSVALLVPFVRTASRRNSR
jgi:hypothetical protein